ncbi:extracellular solute-binding protein [Paenibacillus sediminis]|uniref:ABC-type glycerol-3-phosphate transport system substrate-binding protein n=1 Tax=Paenibacillus sediminis TaxID=664909 RepID=A0ABS4GZ13_9BACL|nr:extracellular solute-binding protein [Paenibacillus sediminis]MBP1935503.1 ABC-type glycerol-3-phosphate transport system substrate-binding protein [Paenibacillus sediminis]
MRRKILAFVMIGILLLCTVDNTTGYQIDRAEAAAGSVASPSSNDDVLDALFGSSQTSKDDPKDKPAQESGKKDNENTNVGQVLEDDYFNVLAQWHKEGITAASGIEQTITPSQFQTSSGPAPLLSAQSSNGYGGSVFRWEKDTKEIYFPVTVPKSGLYNLRIDYYPLSDKIMSVERGVKINGKYPYFQAHQFELYKYWRDESYPFHKDALDNDVLPDQILIPGWQQQYVEDPASADDRPLLFYLKKGSNTISLPYISEPVLLGNITVTSPEVVPTYNEYIKSVDSAMAPAHLTTVEAEQAFSKNEPFIRVQGDSSPSSVPFNSGKVLLNSIGGDSWQTSGQSVTWRFEVPSDGNYQLALKFKQNTNTSGTGTDMPVYRTLRIDGNIPFEEMRRVVFPYTNDWTNKVIADDNNHPYLIHLTKGEHTLTLTANASPYQESIQKIKEVMNGINDLSIQVKMATGNTQDTNRDWDLTDQIPDVAAQLNKYADELSAEFKVLAKGIGRTPNAAKNMIISADRLRNLAKDPNSLPYKYSQLSEGSGSVIQMLGDSLSKLPNQPLTLDRIYIYSDTKLPSPKASWFTELKANIEAFFETFTKDYSKMDGGSDSDALQIWVNRPRQYVMMMQQLANEDFTKKTGIKVSFSLMPDETKLILANAAGNSPDVALSINNTTPFNLAVRGTLTDLTKFPDYDEVVKRFSPGAMLPFQFDGSTYALPETQNFWVMFYRKDILDALHIPVPDTMDDVRQILPDLQRYGLNFYNPLAQTGGYKQFWLTVPLIYQNGGDLFTKDGSGTAIDSENALKGIKQMTDLFTVYNMPLNVPSFFNHFRDGSLPIGIADFSTYVQLTSAAPEINGLWGIAPMPGIKGEDGTVHRWAPGTGQSTVIFKSSKRQNDDWEFLKWWTSAETQSKFGNRMQTIYGPTYKWNTANLEAFGELPWPAQDIEVIKKQWVWLKDIPHIPGDYMLERGISDAWNKIVFDGVNPRRAIEDATIQTNREIAKKLEEFGYEKDGKLIKPLKVPQLPEAKKAGDTDETSSGASAEQTAP